jgi:hypothetical protein
VRVARGATKLLGGRICCIVGILFGAGGILFALLDASANVSSGAVGAALGVLGYVLGARRLGTATIVLGVIAIFFMADLTLTRTQYPAIVCKAETETPLSMRVLQAYATADRSLVMSSKAVRACSSALSFWSVDSSIQWAALVPMFPELTIRA